MRRPSAATGIALVALFFSLAGTGLAASGYLITSVSQISPHVLRYLQGQRGPRGRPGLIGPAGTPGLQGLTGATGAFSTATLIPVAGPQVALCALGGGSCGIGTSVATCPAGMNVVSGGWIGTVISGSPTISTSGSANSWTVTFDNTDTSGGASFEAVALCG